MSATVAQLVALARELADAVSSPRWSDPTIATWIGLEQWRNQAKLLNANNQFYINGPITVTQDSLGQFNLSDLTTGATDSKKYFYRIHLLGLPSGGSNGTSGPLWYRKGSLNRFPPTQPSTSLPYVWYLLGTKIQVLPATASQTLQVYVSYRPPRADQLSATSVTVDYPEGYETGLAMGAAAMMLDKGGAEDSAASVMRALADDLRDDMLLDLGRPSTDPIIAGSLDDPSDWGTGLS